MQHGWKITNALIMDMISYSRRFFGVSVEGTAQFTELMDAAKYNLLEFNGQNLTVTTSKYSFGSDHVSFQKAGLLPLSLFTSLDSFQVFLQCC